MLMQYSLKPQYRDVSRSRQYPLRHPPGACVKSYGTFYADAVGDQVAEDEVICQVETDKTAVPVHAPCAGVIEEILVEDGSTVNPGMSICKLRVGATAKESAPKEAAAAPAEVPAAKSGPPASPSEADVSAPPPTTPPPVPPKPSAPQASKPVSSIKIPVTPTPLPPGQAESTITGTRTEQRVKMNRMRQRIAQRLKEAQNTYAMLTTFNEIDMSNIIEMRNRHKDDFLKKHNVKLGFMSAFVKAAAYALQDQPVVNAGE
ncbi:Dihydrolipoyllysine-residue succinyltransferase component of 2-oxoglutarate dehydrogenase complex, mitochondrial [Araneus ventricosus]|uniref:Dihydrolipoamide acetyltransferase component of pyruvate dehydrogenase complex n=1 Tax=Araneus ventricosus TaxID=182803 RepID=A0A4Y2VNC1_ARAVE|nr:Dihydrolipoyllysine-residue succinyltransferase component of 2-oxoglutarate dehydrogenase complex, mitochondrial [Araneus ventricosus]